jgi:protein-S-isoprenylcysteine O-methyltransferase Ste14
MWLRYFLPVYLAAYFGAAFVWRSYAVWRKSGINPVVFKHTDDAHDFIGKVFKLLFGVVVLVVILYSVFPAAYQYLLPVPWLDRDWIRIAGVTLLIASLVWTILAQSQMGESWRVGIDTENKTQLVQAGVFGISRNPIFLGIMVTIFGLLLALPNAITLTLLVLAFVLVNIQVRLEEEHLKTMIGDEYVRYSRRVRRWI